MCSVESRFQVHYADGRLGISGYTMRIGEWEICGSSTNAWKLRVCPVAAEGNVMRKLHECMKTNGMSQSAGGSVMIV